MKDLIEALREFGPTVGRHWSNDNAAFEATKPTLDERLVRGIDPRTSFGSAFGAMHDAAGQRSIRDMGIAALQSFPLYGVTGNSITSGLKNVARYVPPDFGAWGAKALIGGLTSGFVDQAQSFDKQPR